MLIPLIFKILPVFRFSFHLFLTAFICCSAASGLSAQDSLKTDVIFRPHAVPDSVLEKADTIKSHSPKVAALKSLAVPGWGQIYNRRYWKLPIIYAGFGALTYAIIFNSKEHRVYKQALQFRNDGDSSTIDPFPSLTEDRLVSLKDYYRRNIDLTIVGYVALYALTIIDATVDAHLRDFDISDDLSLSIYPEMDVLSKSPSLPGIQTGFSASRPGVSFVLKF